MAITEVVLPGVQGGCGGKPGSCTDCSTDPVEDLRISVAALLANP